MYSPTSRWSDAVATWLRDKALVPDRVLCSPSRRTRETLDAVVEVVGNLDKRLEPAIYEAMPGTLAGLVDGHRDADRLIGLTSRDCVIVATVSHLLQTPAVATAVVSNPVAKNTTSSSVLRAICTACAGRTENAKLRSMATGPEVSMTMRALPG